ncbi:MAG: hypothetical protein E7017_02465 [Alphaproteobacteria bacterium]|nr:hypothetical protein [Alphaproteobacteria bacterium]
MNNNPLAKTIRNAFIINVANKKTSEDASYSTNTIGNILRHKRITIFEKAINRFFISSGLPPVKKLSQFVDEKNLLTFSLQLSGYIRDSQKELANLRNEDATDPNLINLYKAAAKYSADCSHKIKDSKYVFKEHCDYCFYKVHITDKLSNAKFVNHGFVINPKRRNLILSMPFHIKSTQEELQFWSNKYLNGVLDKLGSDVDIYLAHFPIEQPRGEKFALSLQTIRNPENYFTEADMHFVSRYLSPFLGKDLQIENNTVISGTPHDNETFKQYCLFTIGGYCAGGIHSHRWINAFSHLAEQLYDKKTTNEALQNIFTDNYALLPFAQNSKTSGVYFLSNYADDNLRKEPFVKMFTPEAYEKYKYLPSPLPYRISLSENNQHYIVALNLPEDFAVLGQSGNKETYPDLENGHHMGVVTQRNVNSLLNNQQNLFKTVLTNAVNGKRGAEIFNTISNEHKHLLKPLSTILQKHVDARLSK